MFNNAVHRRMSVLKGGGGAVPVHHAEESADNKQNSTDIWLAIEAREGGVAGGGGGLLKVSEGVGRTFGRLTLFGTGTCQERRDCNQRQIISERSRKNK